MESITEEWLAEVGFRWEWLHADDSKHWLLWLGDAVVEKTARSAEDLGVELAKGVGDDDSWHCWLRADYCGRYTRFVHIRHLRTRDELTTLIAAITGFPFDAANAIYGCYRRPEDAARMREYDQRLEVRMAKQWGQRAMRETGQDEFGSDKIRP